VVFNIEAFIKLSAYHLNYFKDNWNIFDFLCVLVSDIFVVVELAMGDNMNVELGNVITTLRIFRIARLFRLLRFLKGLNQLFYAFIISVPKLFNVAIIMCLLIFLYAVLGINLFAKVAFLQDASGNTLASYDTHANFRTFWKAISLLLRSLTGEGWNEIMHDLAKNRFYYESYMDFHCDPNLDVRHLYVSGTLDTSLINGCGMPYFSYAFFISYTLVVTFVILNLFIAVIFEGFEESSKSEVSDMITACVELWHKRYDPHNRMLLPLDRALDFIDEAVSQICHHEGKDDDASFAMEKRWDTHLKTGTPGGVSPWSLYSLHYMLIMDLRMTKEGDVRFIVAMKAIIRRIICQGGLNRTHFSHFERRDTLKQLAALDKVMESGADTPRLQKELLKIRRLEQRQAHAISYALNPRYNLKLPKPSPESNDTSARTFMNIRTAALNDALELSLVEQVAAAKIQLHAKESFMRRRAKQRASLGHGPSTGHMYDSIARAAG